MALLFATKSSLVHHEFFDADTDKSIVHIFFLFVGGSGRKLAVRGNLML